MKIYGADYYFSGGEGGRGYEKFRKKLFAVLKSSKCIVCKPAKEKINCLQARLFKSYKEVFNNFSSKKLRCIKRYMYMSFTLRISCSNTVISVYIVTVNCSKFYELFMLITIPF